MPEGTNNVERRFDMSVINTQAHVTNIITFLLIVGLSLYMC